MTIAEVCKRYDLTADTLRYYEKVGLLPKIGRTPGKVRNYTDYDCGWIGFIKRMRNAGVGVGPLVEYVRLFEQGDATAKQRKGILIAERDKIAVNIAAMQQTLDRLNTKIERYEKDIIPAEEHLKQSD